MGSYLSDPTLPNLLSDLASRVAALERTRTIPVATGAPSTTPTEGAMQGATGTARLYLYIGGTWRYTALT